MYTSSYFTDLKLLLHAHLRIMIVGGKGDVHRISNIEDWDRTY